jgi:hypothetical protein
VHDAVVLNELYYSNLTHVQARCTELLLENRALKVRLKESERAMEVRGPRNEGQSTVCTCSSSLHETTGQPHVHMTLHI